MDVIYNKNPDLDEENNFVIDLTANNEIDGMFFKKMKRIFNIRIRDQKKPVDPKKLNEFATIKKFSDRIKKAKNDKENKIKHGQILVYLPNFNNLEEDSLIAKDPPKKSVSS